MSLNTHYFLSIILISVWTIFPLFVCFLNAFMLFYLWHIFYLYVLSLYSLTQRFSLSLSFSLSLARSLSGSLLFTHSPCTGVDNNDELCVVRLEMRDASICLHSQTLCQILFKTLLELYTSTCLERVNYNIFMPLLSLLKI